MRETETLEVDPKLIVWARESAGFRLRDAARRIGIKPLRLEQWERISARPTPRQLEKMADVYKRPVAAFFLPEPPSESLPADFRVLPESKREITAPTRFALRRARRLRSVYTDLIADFMEHANSTALIRSNGDSAENLADRARDVLAIGLEAQCKWRNPTVALRVWRERLERSGILVFQFTMPLVEVRGFSISGDGSVVVVNSKDSPAARIFTLFHELAHLILNRPGLCIPEQKLATLDPAGDVEVFCNAFAGNFLVPTAALRERGYVSEFMKGKLSLADALRESATDFSVSEQVILRRLLTLEIISRETFNKTFTQLVSRAPKRSHGVRRGGPHPAVRTITELGQIFVSRVLEAEKSGVINDSDVADLLSIKLKHLNRVQEMLST